MIYESVEDMIGNTPLLKIPEEVHGIPHLTLYAKLEMMNPFGSVKDRIARSMLMPHISKVQQEAKTVIESSSGNTAKALSVLCAKRDIPFQIITNRIKVPEVRDVLKLLDAQIVEMPGASECPDPSNPKDPHAVVEELLQEHPDKYFHTDQYFNQANIQAHRESGKEINRELGEVDYVFANLGTCGTSVGIGQQLREDQQRPLNVVGVITAQGGYVPGGRNENELYETGFFDPTFYDAIAKATTQEAVEGMRKLHHKVGILCGPTTGLVFAAMLQWFKDHPVQEDVRAVFVVCDRLEPYLSYAKKHLPSLFFEHAQTTQLTQEMLEATPDITCEELSGLTKSFIVDIRTHFAYTMGHIQGSTNIPEHLLEEMVRSGPCFPDVPIVVVCPVGRISRRYAALLREQGYDARTLQGGLQAWTQSGRTLNQGLCAHEHQSSKSNG